MKFTKSCRGTPKRFFDPAASMTNAVEIPHGQFFWSDTLLVELLTCNALFEVDDGLIVDV